MRTALVTGASRGQVLIAASIGAEYQVVDIDGRRPKPLTLESV